MFVTAQAVFAACPRRGVWQLLISMAFMLEVFVFTRYAYQLEAVRNWFDTLWNDTLDPLQRYVSVVQLGLTAYVAA
jgi:hypothetical protein